MQNNLEEINYFLEKSNHIFNHTFNMRNQSSLDFNSICKAHPKLDFGQKSFDGKSKISFFHYHWKQNQGNASNP